MNSGGDDGGVYEIKLSGVSIGWYEGSWVNSCVDSVGNGSAYKLIGKLTSAGYSPPHISFKTLSRDDSLLNGIQ